MKLARTLFWSWVALAFAYFTLINTLGTGIANWLLEWQYASIGWFRPTVTLVGLVLLAAVPALLIALIFWRRHRRKRFVEGTLDAVAFASFQIKVLLILAGLAAVGAIVSLLLLLTLPPLTGDVQPMPTSIRSMALPIGPTRLDGFAQSGPTVRFTHRVLWDKRIVRFVPVGGEPGRGARLFVQLDDSGLIPSNVVGVTARDALPPSVRNLFRVHGGVAPGPHYVLYTQPHYVRRPLFLAAGQFAVVGLLILLAALLQQRNAKRARRDREKELAAASAPETAAATG